jgi:hypothetical protein
LFFFCRKKYEIATDEAFTPIKQDEKKGKLREVSGASPCFIPTIVSLQITDSHTLFRTRLYDFLVQER